VIDPVALRKLRHDRGLSQRRLAAVIGVDPLTVKRVECGANPGDWPLRILARLAETLGVAPSQLLQQVAPDVERCDGLARRVGGALLERDRTTLAALATMLDVDISDIRQAVASLDAHLRPAGMSLARHADEVWLVPLTPTRRTTAPERPLSVSEARLLRRIHRGEDVRRNLSQSDRKFTLPALLRGGLIDDSTVVVKPTRETEASLTIDALDGSA
jgi:transcriptional regulator with XRE-family HTH domain